MPFLQQPSQFIVAWDRHQICWLAYPVAKNVQDYVRKIILVIFEGTEMVWVTTEENSSVFFLIQILYLPSE